MASITIRNIDDKAKARLRVRAGEHHPLVAKKVRTILREAVSDGRAGPCDLAKFTHKCFVRLGGVNLELPPCGPMREPPDFS